MFQYHRYVGPHIATCSQRESIEVENLDYHYVATQNLKVWNKMLLCAVICIYLVYMASHMHTVAVCVCHCLKTRLNCPL